LKTTVQNKRDSDTDTLCLAIGGISWEYKRKTVISPLLLIPVSHAINRAKQEITLVPEMDKILFNPFVRNELVRRYGLSWEMPEKLTPADLIAAFYTWLQQKELPFEAVPLSRYGNFHHHRYQVVKELELLLEAPEWSSLVREILGETTGTAEKLWTKRIFTPQLITAADADQQEVFEQFQHGNVVVQGPPGTGKSQVLTNLMAKMLYAGTINLVVSEKKAALEVLVKKLTPYGLDKYLFIAHSQTKPADFISHLKNAWKTLEENENTPAANLLLSAQWTAQLQLTLDKLASRQLIGGVSLSTFNALTANRDFSETPYISEVPDIREWLAQQETLDMCLKAVPDFSTFQLFRQQALRTPLSLDRQLEKLTAEFRELAKRLDFSTFGELDLRIKQSSRAQLLNNESYKKYSTLFAQPKIQRQFEKLRMRFIQQTAKLQLLETEIQNWKSAPTLSEVQSWKSRRSGQVSWWKKRQVERQIRAALQNPLLEVDTTIDNWLQYLQQKQELQEIRAQLLELGVERPELEFESIQYILHQRAQENENELNQVDQLPATLRQALIENIQRLQVFRRTLQETLSITENESITEKLTQAATSVQVLLPLSAALSALPENLYRLLQRVSSATELEAVVLHSNRLKFESLFPELAKYTGDSLHMQLERIVEAENEEHLLFAGHIHAQRRQQFREYHQLLLTPAQALKPEQRTLKSQLKAGKAILVKEFKKSRQHRTIRELVESEARIWIELLNPLWLSTPVQVANIFPLETGIFDCVIFDEASQLSLPNALGSLQRAQRALVAGDEQQMSPSSFFTSSTSTADLLHQASYYWSKVPLKHHYRSRQPELIAFSNQHFYRNELIVYPSPETGGHTSSVEGHYVAEAIFEDRANRKEAEALAKLLQAQLTAPEPEIQTAEIPGIVAFSETQLQAIWNALDSTAQQLLQERIDAGTAFFRTLEQVQGDECDILYISLGYGFDAAGQFNLRFGPLNQALGSKRLNVLLTRARNHIHFFHSVTATDFKWSTNEAIRLLQQFIQSLENEDITAQTKRFPFGLTPEIHGNQLKFKDIQDQLASAQELVTMHRVFSLRGWQVIYEV
jgi:hypothetical protein